ncbi:MAG: polyketide synthase, partial [Candidatus Angelobacter sp.]
MRKKGEKEIDLGSLAYTLQVGREGMEERVGFLVSSVEQVREKLEGYVAGRERIEELYQGQMKGNKELVSLFSHDAELGETVARWMERGKQGKLLEVWVKGLEVDWSKLYGESKPQRMSLPVYPFARERYWMETSGSSGTVSWWGKKESSKGEAGRLHPLVHSNVSDLEEQRYSASFSGGESFLKEDEAGERVLPAAALLEMGRVGAEKAMRCAPGTVLEMRNVEWGEPVVVRSGKQVHVVVLAGERGEVEYEIYSEEGGEEVVHGQGRVRWTEEAKSVGERVDVERFKREIVVTSSGHGGAVRRIYRGEKEALVELRLRDEAAADAGEYVLHPSVVEEALEAAAELNGKGVKEGKALVALSVESIRIVSPCRGEMYAWIRYGEPGQVDIDLCDEKGEISADLRGIRWQEAQRRVAEPSAAQFVPDGKPQRQQEALRTGAEPKETRKEGEKVRVGRREIVLVAESQAKPSAIKRDKPQRIRLGAAGEVSRSTVRKKPVIALATLGSNMSAGRSAERGIASVRLYEEGKGIFSIAIEAESSEPSKMMAELLQALEKVKQESTAKVVKLSGLESCFRRGARADYNRAVELRVYEAVVKFPYPVIASVKGDAVGGGWLGVSLCDFMVCSEEGSYGYTDAEHGYYPSLAEAEVMEERFGAVQAQDLLYVAGVRTGKELRRRGWSFPIMPVGEIEGYAEKLARKLAGKSQEALRLLKEHVTRGLRRKEEKLVRVEVEADAGARAAVTAGEQEQERGIEAREITAAWTEHIGVEKAAERVAVLRLRGRLEQVGVKELAAELKQVLEKMRNAGSKALVLASEDGEFLPAAWPSGSDSTEGWAEIEGLLLQTEVPIVAALNGNAEGAGWLIEQYCDACVYSRSGKYSAAGIGAKVELRARAAASFSYRLGTTTGQEILLTGAAYTGAGLQQRVGTLLVTDPDEVLAKAVEVAVGWAKLPQLILTDWKRHSAASIKEKIGSMRSADEEARQLEGPESVNDGEAVPVAGTIALRSKVVSAVVDQEGIVVVKMEDREARNMFSDALLEGVAEAFRHIEDTPGYKVVILTGYDNYFSSGGTKDNLLAIQGGKAKFTDYKIFEAALNCKLPVIAAMQGHGIGAGWTLGMFADVVLLSEESRYVSPYMNYGFTPGAGATWVLAEKLGEDLARESLFSGEHYAGSELKVRGAGVAVLPRAEVNRAAMTLARQIAQGSRSGLIHLKRQLTEHLRPQIEETYRLELAMHEHTFVGRSDTLALIESRFFSEIEASSINRPEAQHEGKPNQPDESVVLSQAVVSPSRDGDVLAAITATLKTLLAEELHMQPREIDEDVEFIDLGLDSISGVTWVRKINEKYRTSIEATKVYSYPTLTQLSRYVREEE